MKGFATRRAIWPSGARSARKCPIVLGSATPSLETLENVAQAATRGSLLPQRPGRRSRRAWS